MDLIRYLARAGALGIGAGNGQGVEPCPSLLRHMRNLEAVSGDHASTIYSISSHMQLQLEQAGWHCLPRKERDDKPLIGLLDDKSPPDADAAGRGLQLPAVLHRMSEPGRRGTIGRLRDAVSNHSMLMILWDREG